MNGLQSQVEDGELLKLREALRQATATDGDDDVSQNFAATSPIDAIHNAVALQLILEYNLKELGHPDDPTQIAIGKLYTAAGPGGMSFGAVALLTIFPEAVPFCLRPGWAEITDSAMVAMGSHDFGNRSNTRQDQMLRSGPKNQEEEKAFANWRSWFLKVLS